jgi:SAM-dependent methyltransferase
VDAARPQGLPLRRPDALRREIPSLAHAHEFFGTGETYVDWILHIIERHLVPEFSPVTTLEYGCGVGRLAIPFARRPGRVTAVDRSPAMLAAARAESERQQIPHIDFQTVDALFASGRTYDLVNCYGVLQRLEPREGLLLIRRLGECLGAGGVGVFHFPYRAASSRLVRASRRVRSAMPFVNGVANALRGRPFGDPIVATHAYDLDEVFGVLDDGCRELFDAPLAASHLLFERQEGFSACIACVEAPHERGPRAASSAEPDNSSQPIDVAEMIRSRGLDELNQAAELYFSTLGDHEHQLAKPFSNPEETPWLLTGAAALLQGLRLTSGMTVLEFGAGTGWLSRWLTQLGCRVVLLDVSPTALTLARDLYDRQPVIGERPEPQFLTFDGRRIDLGNGAVDRIVSFHAFHHVPNPDHVLEEFARVLKPGGIAGFVEPGPRHSHDPESQFDMRTHAVVENDVDVHAIWRTARTRGFSDMKLAVHHAPPFHVSLEEFEAFLADDRAGQRWVRATRMFLRHVRLFFLTRAGAERIDSRWAAALACRIEARLAGPSPVAGGSATIEATIENTGAATWLPAETELGGVALGAHLYDESGRLLAFDHARQPFGDPSHPVAPGEAITGRFAIPVPGSGRYIVEIDCVASKVAWFAQRGSKPVRLVVDVVSA